MHMLEDFHGSVQRGSEMKERVISTRTFDSNQIHFNSSLKFTKAETIL